MAEEKRIDIMIRWRSNMKTFHQTMKATGTQFRALADETGNLDQEHLKGMTTMGRFGARMRHLTAGFRGFRMEMLSVMFFGMAIQRLFMSLLSPALKLAGAMEMISLILGLMFLPVGLAVQAWAIDLWNWWQKLSEETQNLIRWIVVLGFVLGLLMFILGTLVLGLGGLVTMFSGGGVFAGVTVMVAGIGASFFAIIGIIALIVIVVAAAVLAWKENFMGFRDAVKMIWSGIKKIFSGALEFIVGMFTIFVGLMTGDMDKIKEGYEMMGKGISDFFVGIGETIIGTIQVIIALISRAIKMGTDLAQMTGGLIGINLPDVPQDRGGITKGGFDASGINLLSIIASLLGDIKDKDTVINVNGGGDVVSDLDTITHG